MENLDRFDSWCTPDTLLPCFAGIVMCTPSGRFAPNAKICMSMTGSVDGRRLIPVAEADRNEHNTIAGVVCSHADFHPESWQPAWSVGTILTGLVSPCTAFAKKYERGVSLFTAQPVLSCCNGTAVTPHAMQFVTLLACVIQLSFMLEEAPTTGSVTSTAQEKQQLAAQSLDFNVSGALCSFVDGRCSCRALTVGSAWRAVQVQNLQFRKLFPDWVERKQQGHQQQQESQAQVRAICHVAMWGGAHGQDAVLNFA
jgi:hypothetical protein